MEARARGSLESLVNRACSKSGCLCGRLTQRGIERETRDGGRVRRRKEHKGGARDAKEMTENTRH